MEQKQLLQQIQKTVELNAPIEKVWDAVATSEGIAKWWMKNTFNPEKQEFHLISDAWGKSPCKITKIDPPYHLSFDWDKDWHIDFTLKKLDSQKCEFTLIHSGWNENKQTFFGQPHTAIHKTMDDGWTNIVNNRLTKVFE